MDWASYTITDTGTFHYFLGKLIYSWSYIKQSAFDFHMEETDCTPVVQMIMSHMPCINMNVMKTLSTLINSLPITYSMNWNTIYLNLSL